MKSGEWALVLLRAPGTQPIPGGVLLLDLAADRLYVRVRDDLVDLDPDVTIVLELLTSDLVEKAAEMGGLHVMRWLEEEGSHTISLGDRQQLQMTLPELALDELFCTHVQQPTIVPGAMCDLTPEPRFKPSDIAAACEKLPISKVVGIQSLKAFQDPTSSFDKAAEILARDPVLSAHLIRFGNLASVSRGEEIRSVSQALTRIGADDAKLHIWGLCMKNLYSSPHLQQIWNHSLLTVSVIAEFCHEVRYSDVQSAKLVAMLHDIGQIVFSALGSSYLTSYWKLLAQGLYPLEIERSLCGMTHAEVGADLLTSWGFPEDMSEAVRHHHSPSKSTSILTNLLYCSESWTDHGEDIYNPVEHDHVIRALGLHGRRLDFGKRFKPDLKLLRFAV